MKTLVIVAVLLVSGTVGITDDCVRAICQATGGGCMKRACGYRYGRRGCGYFNIDRDYYRQCGTPGHGWVSCANDYGCAERCVHRYLSRYGTSCTGGRWPVCEDNTRIHFGGPRGCHSSDTSRYWARVQHRLRRVRNV